MAAYQLVKLRGSQFDSGLGRNVSKVLLVAYLIEAQEGQVQSLLDTLLRGGHET